VRLRLKGVSVTVKRYVKKPVVIEAVRWDGSNLAEVQQFNPDCYWNFGAQKLCMPTLEGYMYAAKGDYIIRGVKGEFYPCKPDIFERTYGEVES
jgi:hypothetical protein